MLRRVLIAASLTIALAGAPVRAEVVIAPFDASLQRLAEKGAIKIGRAHV